MSVIQGWALIRSSLVVLRRHPILAAPLTIAWIFQAAIILYLRYNHVDTSVAIFLIAFIPLSLTIACLALLEMIRQIEWGHPIAIGKVLNRTFGFDLVQALPIAFVWTVLWFILAILRGLTRRSDDEDDYDEYEFEDAAATLSGMNQSTSLLQFGFDMLEKMMRMVVFTMLPAIVWQDMNAADAYKSGKRVISQHSRQFFANYGLTAAAGWALAGPLIPFAILHKADVVFPSWVWAAVIVYSMIIWTVEIYLEQMSTAMLYLWHLKWELAGEHGQLRDIPMPNLLDEVYEFREARRHVDGN